RIGYMPTIPCEQKINMVQGGNSNVLPVVFPQHQDCLLRTLAIRIEKHKDRIQSAFPTMTA
ncbi:MAG: hypothetical protein ACOYLR_10290, partial [Chlorobium sp.]